MAGLLLKRRLFCHFAVKTRQRTNKFSISTTNNHKKPSQFEVVSLKSYNIDRTEVLRLLVETYKKDWPPIYMLSKVPTDIDGLLTSRIENYLKNGSEMSIGLRDTRSGRLAAAIVGCIIRKGTYVKEDGDGYSEGVKHIIRIQRQVEGDVFTDLNTNAIVKLGASAVDPNYANMKLMRTLSLSFYEAASASGAEYMFTVSTSEYSNRLKVKGVDFTLREIEYSQYRDPQTGVKPFIHPFPPHTHARLIYRRNVCGV